MPHSSYLIQSLSVPNKFYIGYTTCVERRLKQHNGELSGGAHETQKNRPWALVCYVSGFKNESIGLQFEWAFQHPKRSKIFRDALPGRMAITREVKATAYQKDLSVVGYLRRMLILLCETHFGSNEFTDRNSLIIHFSNDVVYGKFIQLIDDFKRDHEKYSNDSDDSHERKPFCIELPEHVVLVLLD
jgi:predicted GIY-YIG superfamily endonuclease